jgi:hypothetical protein
MCDCGEYVHKPFACYSLLVAESVKLDVTIDRQFRSTTYLVAMIFLHACGRQWLDVAVRD